MSVGSAQYQDDAERGKKLMKTGVAVFGRFLLLPGEEFNAVVARQLLNKAKRQNVRVKTDLRVFAAGIQLGDRGVFAGMPTEFIRFHRLADMVVLTNEPTILIICVKDYDEKCVTIMQLKDTVCIQVVTDLVGRYRAAYIEQLARMPEFGYSLRKPHQNVDAHADSSRAISRIIINPPPEQRNSVANGGPTVITGGEDQTDTHMKDVNAGRALDTGAAVGSMEIGNSDHVVVRSRQIGTPAPVIARGASAYQNGATRPNYHQAVGPVALPAGPAAPPVAPHPVVTQAIPSRPLQPRVEAAGDPRLRQRLRRMHITERSELRQSSVAWVTDAGSDWHQNPRENAVAFSSNVELFRPNQGSHDYHRNQVTSFRSGRNSRAANQ